MPFLWKVCKMGERKVQLPPHVQRGCPHVLWPGVLPVTDFPVSISMHSNFRLSQILRQPQGMCVESNSQAQDVHFYILMSSFLLVFGLIKERCGPLPMANHVLNSYLVKGSAVNKDLIELFLLLGQRQAIYSERLYANNLLIYIELSDNFDKEACL